MRQGDESGGAANEGPSLTDLAPPLLAIDNDEISVRYDREPANLATKERRDRLQLGLFFEPGVCALSWGDTPETLCERRLTGPQLFLIPAGIAHAIRWEKTSELLVLHLAEVYWRRMAPQNVSGLMTAEPGGTSGDVVLWLVASTLRSLASEPDGPDVRLARTMVANAFVIRALKLMFGGPTVVSDLAGGLSANRLRAVDAYIDRQLRYDIHVADLAKQVGLSVNHFTTVFKEKTGFTPYEYITRRRMLRAYELLSTGEFRVAEVAHAVGYDNHSNFGLRFREFFKVTPSEVLGRRGHGIGESR